jgi:hypothetical protein
MKNTIRKKAYFFLLDGIFAMIILLIGYLLLSKSRITQTPEIPMHLLSESTMDFLSSVKVYELCSNLDTCTCSNTELSQLCNANLIDNYYQSLLDLMGSLYPDQIPSASSLFQGLTSHTNMLREDIFNVELRINDALIYSSVGNPEQSKDEARELISTKKIIFGFSENFGNGQVEFWGPYLAEVNIWPK